MIIAQSLRAHVRARTKTNLCCITHNMIYIYIYILYYIMYTVVRTYIAIILKITQRILYVCIYGLAEKVLKKWYARRQKV